MNTENKNILEGAFPDMPAQFDYAMRKQLEEIQMSEKKRIARRTVVLVILSVMLMCGAAMAITGNLNLFNFFDYGEEYQTVQPDAYALMQTDVAFYSFDHVDVTIKEAVWDGRVMRILYSIRDRAATSTYDDESILNGETPASLMEAAQADGITAYYGCDWMTINGRDVCLTGGMSARAGANNGEILIALESDLSDRLPIDAPDMVLGDTFTVSLPFKMVWLDGNTKRVNETPQELTFTVNNKELVGVKNITLPDPIRFENYTLTFKTFMISPIRIYLDYDLTFDAGMTYEEVESIVNMWSFNVILSDKDGNNALIEFENSNGVDGYKMEIIDDEHFTESIPADVPAVGHVYTTFITSDSYPDVFALTPGTRDADYNAIPIPELRVLIENK